MEFHILGHFELISNEGDEVALTRPFVRGLVVALVLHRNQSLSAERLIDLLWGSEPQTDRSASLRSLLWSTRKLLPATRLVTDGSRYRLRVETADVVDVDRFRRLHRQGNDALEAGDDITAAWLLHEALDLWADGGLVDQLPSTPAMESLVTGLVEEQRAARNALVRARLALGQHRELVSELRTLLTDDPLNEQLWADLMLATYQDGLRAEALEVFEEADGVLADAAGTEPGTELQTLHHRILANDPALAPDPIITGRAGESRRRRPPRHLPSDLADFTGRAGDAAELIALLSADAVAAAVPVAEVTGPPGIGKSALAVHVAHAVAHDYPDGQLHVHLAGTSPAPPPAEVVLGELLRTLGLNATEIPETTEQRAAAFRSRLAGHRVLIVLDDAADPEQVRPLLPGTTGCAVIVTSRTQLAGLAGGRSIHLDPLDETDSSRLLRRIIGRTRMDAELDAAAEVVAACDGFPLAIRIAGERLTSRPAWPIAYLAEALRDERRRLDELVIGDLAVRSSIAHSFHALDSRAQRLLRLLALTGTGEIAGWVGDVLLGEDTAGALGTLADHSLLVADGVDAAGQPRFHLHDLVRAYAAELLTADPDAEPARRRLLDGWRELTDLADRAMPRPLYAPILTRPPIEPRRTSAELRRRVAADPRAWFDAERRQLTSVIGAACAAGEYRLARELTLRTAAYLYGDGYHEEAERAWASVADAAEAAGDTGFAARAGLRAAIVIAADRGRHARALPLIDRWITVFEESGDRRRLARAHGIRAFCGWSRDQPGQARLDGERGLVLAREAEDPHAEFFCLRMLAVAYSRLGRHGDGIACGERALTIAEDLNATTYICAALYTLVRSQLLAGRPNRVIDLCRRGLTLAAETGRELVRAHFHQQMGIAYQYLACHEDAKEALTVAAGDFQSHRDHYQAANCLQLLADSFHATGRHHEAITLLEKSIAAFHDLGSTYNEAQARKQLDSYVST